MDRRLVLKQLVFLTAGSFFLPAVFSKSSIKPLKDLNIDPETQALLASVADTIIPETDTPGAKELNIHLFVMKMIDDCYEKEVQERFFNGLVQLDKLNETRYGKSFESSSVSERLALLTDIQNKKVEDKDVLFFFPLMKKLTLDGYLNSEYVMINLIKYELIPARYNGYFPVQTS